jgi:hypothetical protein
MQSPDIETLLRVDGNAGPALGIGAEQMDAIVNGALDAVFPVPGGGGSAAGGGGAGAKIAAVVAGVAAVAVGAWFLLREPEKQTFTFTFTSTTTPTITTTTTTTITEPEPEPEPIEMRPEAVPDPKPKAEEKQAVEDLMAEANAARKAKEWKKAEAIYARVVEEFRGTSAAQVALVASATLRLEHLGDPRGAVKRFKQAAGGPLAEEARYGLAEAYRALGDDAKEAEALTEFLRHHGDSPLADRARKRRTQLP